MAYVIDASVAVKFLAREIGTEQALRYLDLPDALFAPDMVMIEVANALWKKVKDSELLEVHVERALDDLPEFFDPLVPTTALLAEAFSLSFRLRHPVYDCVYLVLAMREGVRLVTADRRFLAATKRMNLDGHVELLA